MAQPVSGTAKAGDSGSGQGGGQGDKVGEMEGGSLEDFLNTGRTGRRNAVPDISEEKEAALSTMELPLEMAKLSCSAEGGSADPSSQASPASSQASNKPS